MTSETAETPRKARYSLSVITHKDTGWMLAASDELPGLFVQGKDVEELTDRAPRVIRRMLERQGRVVERVTMETRPSKVPNGFVVEESPLVAIVDLAA